MAKLRVLAENPPPPRGNGENQLRELRDYITRMKDELEYLLTHLGEDNLDNDLLGILDGKQDALIFDAAPTNGSGNPVTSGGIYDAILHRAKVMYSYSGSGTTVTFGIPSNVAAYFVYGTAYNATRVFGAIVGRQGDTTNVVNLTDRTISATISDNVMTVTAPTTYAHVYVLIYQ